MAGHSQFKNIMHRKGKQDAMRSKLFAKLAREITVAAKTGTPDPAMNPRLRLAIQEARAENMPKDNIERAIKKAQGGDLANYEAVRYEGYAPGGVAVIVEALTDNRNRTGGVVRSVFTKYNGNLGATGAVAHMFNHIGEITYKAGGRHRQRPFWKRRSTLAPTTCSRMQTGTSSHARSRTSARSLPHSRRSSAKPQSVKAIWKPNLTTPVDEDNAQTIMKMLAALEDDDDVQNVFANFEISGRSDEEADGGLSGNAIGRCRYPPG